ncbi:uncharacterized protein LOC142557298 isoform X2 [Dermacentor variabilis]
MITAIKDKEEPSEGWTSYHCTVLFKCADYDDARLKEQRATEMCDIDSDDGCYEPKKRRAQQRTSSNEESVCASDTESGTAVPGPPPPKFRKTAPSKGTTIPLQPSAPTVQPDASTMQPLPTASVQAILKVQEETLKLLKETKAQLDTLANAVQGLKNSGRPEQTSGDTVDSGMLDLLPLDTHRDLEKLEQYLRIPKNKTELKHYKRHSRQQRRQMCTVALQTGYGMPLHERRNESHIHASTMILRLEHKLKCLCVPTRCTASIAVAPKHLFAIAFIHITMLVISQDHHSSDVSAVTCDQLNAPHQQHVKHLCQLLFFCGCTLLSGNVNKAGGAPPAAVLRPVLSADRKRGKCVRSMCILCLTGAGRWPTGSPNFVLY